MGGWLGCCFDLMRLCYCLFVSGFVSVCCLLVGEVCILLVFCGCLVCWCVEILDCALIDLRLLFGGVSGFVGCGLPVGWWL